MSNAGPPPVQPSRAVVPSGAQQLIQSNYEEVVRTFRQDGAAEVRAMRAMFNGDKTLMDRFLSVAFSLLAKQSNLLKDATPLSIVQSIKDAASLGLEPMTDDGAIIERGGIATFNPMWRGYLKRIRNSGKVSEIDCQLVYDNDEFSVALGTDPDIRHIPTMGERGNYRGAYAWALMPSGVRIIEWMTTADINQIRDQFSKAKKEGTPWQTSWGEMARKTVIRRLAKRLPGAAVDAILTIDQRNDQLAAELAAKVERIDDDMSEVRNLALRAVSGEEPSDVPSDAATEDAAAGATDQAAASDEDEQLRRIRHADSRE